jgi:hypothetical protein
MCTAVSEIQRHADADLEGKDAVLRQAKEYIPATVQLISACLDEQESADISNEVAGITLPDQPEKACGASTSTLLEIMYQLKKANNVEPRPFNEIKPTDAANRDEKKENDFDLGKFFVSMFQRNGNVNDEDKNNKDHPKPENNKEEIKSAMPMTNKDVIFKMRELLKERGYSQIPQLSSSRPMDLDEAFDIVPSFAPPTLLNVTSKEEQLESHDDVNAPTSAAGTKRALVIGINYRGTSGELSGCHNDAKNMIAFLKVHYGFEDRNITILIDDDVHTQPTKANIMAAFEYLAHVSEPGDAIVMHYAGHGGRVKDLSGDEEDGFDESMVPVDFRTAGQILDDDIFMTLVHPLKEGVYMTCIIDCCHSGTILDLPFTFLGNGTQKKMECRKGRRPFPHWTKVRRKKLWEEWKYAIVIGSALMWVAPVVAASWMNGSGKTRGK